MTIELNPELVGWWRIVETSQWANDHLDDLGPAVMSITGSGDRLRMLCLLAYVDFTPTQGGASFTWRGAWEFDQMTGRGSVSTLEVPAIARRRNERPSTCTVTSDGRLVPPRRPDISEIEAG
jgi:hypothetical protein